MWKQNTIECKDEITYYELQSRGSLLESWTPLSELCQSHFNQPQDKWFVNDDQLQARSFYTAMQSWGTCTWTIRFIACHFHIDQWVIPYCLYLTRPSNNWALTPCYPSQPITFVLYSLAFDNSGMWTNGFLFSGYLWCQFVVLFECHFHTQCWLFSGVYALKHHLLRHLSDRIYSCIP